MGKLSPIWAQQCSNQALVMNGVPDISVLPQEKQSALLQFQAPTLGLEG